LYQAVIAFRNELMSAHSLLRAATVDSHAAVDDVFSAYDMSDAGSYRKFLEVNAEALMPLERLLSNSVVDLPIWHPRAPLLQRDLLILRSPPPAPAAILGNFSAAMLHGVLYVLEGSRLGGRVLSQRVGAGLPKAYLGAVHAKGEWRSFLAAVDAAGTGSSSWLAGAVTGAKFAFDHYLRAAAGAKFSTMDVVSAKPLQPER
jgi:heme oxygenase